MKSTILQSANKINILNNLRFIRDRFVNRHSSSFAMPWFDWEQAQWSMQRKSQPNKPNDNKNLNK